MHTIKKLLLLKQKTIMKRFLLFSFLSFIQIVSFSQNVDSLTFVSADWNKTKVKNKVHFYRHHFNEKNLFNSNQNISYVEIKRGCFAPKLQIGYHKNQLITTGNFGKQYNAAIALNGSFFDIKNGGSVNYLRIDNEVIDTNRISSQTVRGQRALAAVGIDKKGKLHIAKFNEQSNWEKGYNWPHMLASGPILQYKGNTEELKNEKFNTARHPRSAVGVKANGNVILLTVDGRHANAQGADMWEMQKIMRWLGCVSSINLDGGGSTTLWIKGFPDNGVVNYPSDNKQWDHYGERKVANVILVK